MKSVLEQVEDLIARAGISRNQLVVEDHYIDLYLGERSHTISIVQTPISLFEPLAVTILVVTSIGHSAYTATAGTVEAAFVALEATISQEAKHFLDCADGLQQLINSDQDNQDKKDSL